MKHKDKEHKKIPCTISLSFFEATIVDLFAHTLHVSRSKFIRDSVFRRIENDSFVIADKKNDKSFKRCMDTINVEREKEDVSYNRAYLLKNHKKPAQILIKKLKEMSIAELDIALKNLDEAIKNKGKWKGDSL